MAFKPYSIIFMLFFAVSVQGGSADFWDPHFRFHSRRGGIAKTSSDVGTLTTPSIAALADGDVPFVPSSNYPKTRDGQVNQSLSDQLSYVEILTANSIVEISPSHLKGLSFDSLLSPTARNASGTAAVTPEATERLCAGPDIAWDQGDMGMAAFVARGDKGFWDNTPYNAYKYWLVKGPHKDGDRRNFPDHQLFMYGSDKKFRLENVSRIGNLTVSGVKSPYAKIFEGTDSPIKDKYNVVNLAGVGSGVGSAKDDWSCLTASGGLLDVSRLSSGTKYVLRGRSLTLKNNDRALAMPLCHKDIDPDFGVGLTLKDDASWTTGKSGPNAWVMDLGYDIPKSQGGSISQGGLWRGYPVQNLTAYLWGEGGRAYLNPGQNLCIDTHDGKARSWLPVPDGWSRTTDCGEGRSGHAKYWDWVDDGKKGIGRVDVGPYLKAMFPAAYFGYDQGLSLWNGQRIFRFRASRIKGGSCRNEDNDIGVFVTKPMGGVNFPADMPWVMPRVKGMPDGKFDTTAKILSVSEVSARLGDAAISSTDRASHGITKWKFETVYPYPVVARCAGRYDGVTTVAPASSGGATAAPLVGKDAVDMLAKFFGQKIPKMIPCPSDVTCEPSNNICYGSMLKLQHRESGQYLVISKYKLPSDQGGFYVTCTPDSSEAAWWMVAPSKDSASRAGGVVLRGGEEIGLIDRASKKVLCAVNIPPPLSANYAADSDSEITPDILSKFNMSVAAYGGTLPAGTVAGSPNSWTVAPAGLGTMAAIENPAILSTSGLQFQNNAFGGFLSSVNGYRFQPIGESDWVQEVTVFESQTENPASDAGAFGTWMLADFVPAPSSREDMNNAGFEGPLTSFDGKVFRLVQVAMGTDGCVYGVDGAQNAIKIDLTKKIQEQIATGVKQVAVGADDALIMLKVDGTVILRPSGGSDIVIPGCLGRSVAIGNASTFAACSADGTAQLGHLMFNESNQLLARQKDGSAIDITDDGYVFGIKPLMSALIPAGSSNLSATPILPVVPGRSALSLWKKSSSALWNDISLGALDQEIARISAGSSRFIALHGRRGGLFVLNSAVGSDIFSNPDQLLTDKTKLNASAWKKITVDGTPAGAQIIISDAAMSSNGDLAVLAGQVNENFEFPIFMRSFAPWPKESDIFNLKVENGSAESTVLVCNNEHGYLAESVPLAGQNVGTQDQGTVSQFSMASLDGYVTLQAKSGQAMKNSNSAVGLNKDDKLQNKNLMTGKNRAGIALSAGIKLDPTLENYQLAVGFGGEKFKSSKDVDSVLEKFMFYGLEPAPDGSLRFKLQSKATGGYLKLDRTNNCVVSISKNSSGAAQPITSTGASIFVLSNVSSADLKLQQGLIGKSPRDAMSVIEAAFVDGKSYGHGVEAFFKNILHWLDGVRISPEAWIDFTQTKSDWVDPFDKLKKSVTASERLKFMTADLSINANPILQPIFADSTQTSALALLKTIRQECDAASTPDNLGLIKNVKDGSVIALRSKFGVGYDGKLTTNKDEFASELYVAVDPVRNVATLSRTTAIDPNVQWHMKVVPSPLASLQNADDGHNAADVQRWMLQSSNGADATVKRMYVPSLSGVNIDSKAVALNSVALRFGTLADTAPSTLLPAYFDVDTVTTMTSAQTQISLQSASNSGYWAIGESKNPNNIVKTGLPVVDLTTGELKDNGVLDLDIRTQDVIKSDNGGMYSACPVVGASVDGSYGPAVFEIVVITPVMAQLTAAFKKTTLDDQTTDFLAVSKNLEKTVDAVIFCQSIIGFVKNSVRNSQTNWNAFVGNRSARDKLAQAITSIKQLFADDLSAVKSNIKSFVDNLSKAIDVARVPSFGVTKSRADLIIDLRAQVNDLSLPGGLDNFVASGSIVSFISNLQRGVNDWFTSIGIAVSDQKIQDDGDALATIISDYKNAIGTSLIKTDRDTLDGLSLTLTNSMTISNPIDTLQGIVTANTVGGVVTFGSDAKYSFLSKLWELYKSSTLDLDPTVASTLAVQGGKIVSRGDIFGLSPAQLTQLSSVLISVSKAPSGPSATGGPFFADDATGDVRSGTGNDAWGWKDQPFGDLANTQIINQLAVLFASPTFLAFVRAYLQYLAASQDMLGNLATSTEQKDQAQVQRFALRLITLAEQWNTWKKGATPRLQRQELNQFKSLIRSVKSFVRSNIGLKQRTDKLLAVVQSAIDQLV